MMPKRNYRGRNPFVAHQPPIQDIQEDGLLSKKNIAILNDNFKIYWKSKLNDKFILEHPTDENRIYQVDFVSQSKARLTSILGANTYLYARRSSTVDYFTIESELAVYSVGAQTLC